MKSKRLVKSNEKQDMSRDERFDLWIQQIDEQYGLQISFDELFYRCLRSGKELFLIRPEKYQRVGEFLYAIWSPLFSKFCINDLLKVFVFSIKHNISTLETINFNLLYKNKERFGSWETAILITKAISKDEATITK